MTDYKWLKREGTHLRELEVARPQTAQMENIGCQTAQPTGGENGTKYATSVIKWMRSSGRLRVHT